MCPACPRAAGRVRADGDTRRAIDGTAGLAQRRFLQQALVRSAAVIMRGGRGQVNPGVNRWTHRSGGDVINCDAALGHQLLDVLVGQPVPQVPGRRPTDHLLRLPRRMELLRQTLRHAVTTRSYFFALTNLGVGMRNVMPTSH